jgi:hypothetical protein
LLELIDLAGSQRKIGAEPGIAMIETQYMSQYPARIELRSVRVL